MKFETRKLENETRNFSVREVVNFIFEFLSFWPVNFTLVYFVDTKRLELLMLEIKFHINVLGLGLTFAIIF